jgi:uncharacterized phiE125 gp8 family phage protein
MLFTTARADWFPVSLIEAKEYLKVSHTDEDSVILRALKSAIEFCENKTGLSFALQTYEYRLDNWPTYPDEITLPRSPVVDVLSVKYLDENGVLQTVVADDWNWERTSDGAVVVLGEDFDSPTLQDRKKGVVRITFQAGFDDPTQSGSGDDPDLKLPEQAKTAILMLTAHWYEHREAAMGDETYPNVMAANEILSQLRVYR